MSIAQFDRTDPLGKWHTPKRKQCVKKKRTEAIAIFDELKSRLWIS